MPYVAPLVFLNSTSRLQLIWNHIICYRFLCQNETFNGLTFAIPGKHAYKYAQGKGH